MKNWAILTSFCRHFPACRLECRTLVLPCKNPPPPLITLHDSRNSRTLLYASYADEFWKVTRKFSCPSPPPPITFFWIFSPVSHLPIPKPNPKPSSFFINSILENLITIFFSSLSFMPEFFDPVLSRPWLVGANRARTLHGGRVVLNACARLFAPINSVQFVFVCVRRTVLRPLCQRRILPSIDQ